METPKSIKYPKTFTDAKPAGFDGIFDWSFTEGCFGDTKITPMDIDGIIERRKHFLVFETKNKDTPIPIGQMITLKELYKLGCFTMIFIYGKTSPDQVMVWCEKGFLNGYEAKKFKDVTTEGLREFIKMWYEYANKTI